MRKPTIVALMVVTFTLGMALAVFVGGSASAASPKGKKTTTTKKTTTSTKAKAPPPLTTTEDTTTTESPGDTFSVLNGTVNAASDHEIIGSSAFPNFTTGAVDNYYAMAHSHVDNSPFAQGTASPADTGPIGQTAAAGNTQQPQYADARWPGDSGKATYGNQGGPYATAEAGEYRATADASEATNGLSGPGIGGKPTLAMPNGFPIRLREVLSAWKTKWQDRLNPNRPTPTSPPPIPTPTIPKPKLPNPPVTTPVATVTTPVATVTTPTSNASVGGASPAPPVTVPSTPPLPPAGAQGHPSRSLAASSTSGDGESALSSSTSATLVLDTSKPKAETTTTPTTTTKKSKTKKPKKPAKSYALVLSGESSLGRVTLGGGQIVIEGIHVTASITNNGTPTYKAAVSVASASIGGIPVTIDEDGVHVSGQGQGLPYQQASDALNGALKQAGIKLFLVGPEVTTCGQAGAGSGGGSGTTTTSSDQSGASSSCDQQGAASCDQTGPGAGMPPIPTPSSGDQSGTTSSCDQSGGMCPQAGTANGTGTGTSTTSSTTSSDQSGTTSSCDQMGATCDQAGTAGGGTGAGGIPGIGTTTTSTTTATTTTKTSGDKTGTTATSSWCGQFGTAPMTGSCASTGKGTNKTTTSSDQAETTDTTTTMSPGDQLGLGSGTAGATEQTVTATGVHVVFTQPVSPPGVPAQYVEHILGEVFVDSLAAPALPLPDLGLSDSSLYSSSSSSCLGGRVRGAGSGASLAGGGSSAGGSGLSGSPSGSSFGSTPGTSSSTGNSLPVAFATALRKPLWLLLAYLVWQGLVIGTGWSLWNWRRGGPT